MDGGILDVAYIVGIVLLALCTIVLLVLRALPIIISAIFEVSFQILSIIAQILAMAECKPKRKIYARR